MSQKLHFKTPKFSRNISESFAIFTPEEIHALLGSYINRQNPPCVSSEEYFFSVPTKAYLWITNNEMEEVLGSDYHYKARKLFDPQKTTFLMVDEEIWGGIKKITTNNILSVINDGDESMGLDGGVYNKSLHELDRILGVTEEYKVLADLYENNMLFAEIY